MLAHFCELCSQEGQAVTVVKAGQPLFIEALLVLLIEKTRLARHQPLCRHRMRRMAQLLGAINAMAVIVCQQRLDRFTIGVVLEKQLACIPVAKKYRL
ncbi:hypothetical protein D3C76_928420 [compost metagenome]